MKIEEGKHNVFPFFVYTYEVTGNMKKTIIILFVFLMSCNANRKKQYLGLLPYSYLNVEDTRHLNFLKQKIEAAYGFKVVVLPKVRIPEHSRVSENKARFRADKLLSWQLQEKPDSISYVLGIISQDISTTKKDKNGNVKEPKWKYDDWGIFGLGYRPGKSAIISTYRLGNNQELKYERLDKIALHEIGHNLGLKHCSSEENCVMQDAAETIKTVDRVLPRLCKECSKKITR